MSSLNPRNQNQWRFTFETLAHIPILRLYLVNSAVSTSLRCVGVKSDLQLGRSLLVVSWVDSERSEEVSVRVPVPRVLIDPGSDVVVRARDDHIEVKMQLVLPVDHPVAVNLQGMMGSDGDLERFRPIELGSDLKNLSAGDVNLFCKVCSTRLTKQPLRRFLEMPSVNWREVADNWFGACCCSFGSISEKLVLQYIKTYDCAEGTCLVDNAAVIICKDDLQGYTFEQTSETNNKVDTEINGNIIDGVKESCHNASEDILDACAISSSIDHKVGRNLFDPESMSSKYDNHSNSFTCSTSSEDCSAFERGHDSALSSSVAQLSLNETQSTVAADSLRLSHGSASLAEPIPQYADELSSTDHCHCCPDEAIYVGDSFPHANAKQQFPENYGPERIQKWLHDCSLGSGFMNRISNLSNDVQWVEFLCKSCSSILGAYPSYKDRNEPVDGGIRLFKCCISTSIPVGGPQDIFRKYTLERIFVMLLLEGAKDELSYRIVLRDLRTKSPILQIVLLNSESWCSTGYCLENETMRPLPEVVLQSVVKVLFSECSAATEASARIIKDWSLKTHTEEVYMMSCLIEDLTKCLKLTANRLPDSCSYLQEMSLSSMER